ncbi:SIS domain-containing protein [Paenarthrobacter sp. OM7]|uniref:MurR/RpiR family transcriptional regulator n=1 Tax=Paenarthrobacter sp. AMU7 TaxID=3162492 RepID=A0AB39YM27_9MICC|nr:SIS domain-containing protein [Paenarthrobacter sp. OM7]WGM20454.1 SIS domain-containing protein [Paenarthrobacter sp. OM7]
MNASKLNSPHERYDARLQRRSSAVLKSRLLQAETSTLETAVEALSTDVSIERASAHIVKARRRYIYGAGKSFGYASLMGSDLSASLTHVYLVDGTVIPVLDVLSDVRSTDVLVVFSLRRYRREVVEAAQRFKQAGGVLIAITDSHDAPLASIADEVVLVQTSSASYTDSSVAVVLVVHLLSTLTTASAKGAGRRLLERDRLSTQLNLYVGD